MYVCLCGDRSLSLFKFPIVKFYVSFFPSNIGTTSLRKAGTGRCTGLCVHVLWFSLFSIGASGGLRSLIVALPGDLFHCFLLCEPRHEKTCLRGFRPGNSNRPAQLQRLARVLNVWL